MSFMMKTGNTLELSYNFEQVILKEIQLYQKSNDNLQNIKMKPKG